MLEVGDELVYTEHDLVKCRMMHSRELRVFAAALHPILGEVLYWVSSSDGSVLIRAGGRDGIHPCYGVLPLRICDASGRKKRKIG